MAKATKLKVFRTPIGFHDAYVAAASQKAALEAWEAAASPIGGLVCSQPKYFAAPVAIGTPRIRWTRR